MADGFLLSGLRVIDAASFIAGPVATTMLADLALPASGPAPCVVSNNLFSADIVAFYPASALDHIDPPTNDNDLAWLLRGHQTGSRPEGPAVQ